MDVELLYLNGAVLPLSEGSIHVEDRGFQLGDGVYEVVKIMNGRAIWLQEHLERLAGSLAAIRLAGATDGHRLEEVVPDLIARSGVVTGSAYVQVTRGAAPRDFDIPKSVEPTVIAYTRSKPGPSREAIFAGEALQPVDDRRWAYCNIKAIDLLASVLAKEEARSAGAGQALFVAPDGTVREGGSSNVFALLGGTLRTHPADNHILAGITRHHVMRLAREAGYKVEERAFALSDITSGAHTDCEVFVVSTLKDIMPVVRVGTHIIGDGRPGKLTLALLDRFRRHQAELACLEPPAALS
jgi:D-alanine transaminase